MNLGLKIKKAILDYAQNLLNKLYAREGLTDYVLEKQILINSKRHELDLADENEMVYERFVQ